MNIWEVKAILQYMEARNANIPILIFEGSDGEVHCCFLDRCEDLSQFTAKLSRLKKEKL